MKTTKRTKTLMTLAAVQLALSAQQTFAQDWTPANSGVPTALWLDANDASTITKDGGDLVSQWNDKSGNARHVTQATAANQPTYQAAGLNSKPTVYFNAASRYLTSASVSAHSGPWSVFAVAKRESTATGYGVILGQDGNSGTRIAQYARFTNSGSHFETIALHPSGGYSSSTQSGAVTSPCIVGSVCSSSSVTAYLNGAGGSPGAISGTLATGSRPITVGRIDYGGAESYLKGYVSEIILVPSAVSATDRQKFEGYLAWKWDTVASLPSGHPCKSAPPPSAALSVTLTRPTSGQVIFAGSSVSSTATAAGGTPPYTVKFYLDGSGTPASTTPNATSPLTVNLGVLSAGPHTVHATVTDSTSTTVGSGTAVPFSVIVDTTAPTPNPMAFAGNPVSNNATSLTMTAGIATDALSPPVQYYFENITNGNNSGWISSPMWTNTGLTTDLTYSFRVKARDSATPPNQTAFSSTLTGVPVKDPGLRCEDLVAPLGVDSPQPALSWQYEDTALTRGQKQSAYRILVASTAANLAANQGDLWDSGQVASEQSLRVPYAGTALTSRQRCHWKVRVWDKDGSPSAWSASSEWTMGLLNPAAWTAKWIAHSSETFPHPWMRRNFEVTSAVNRALVHVNTPGHYELYVNGAKVGEDVLAPAYSDFTKRMFVIAHDVTSLLQPGTNCIALWTAPGWYQPRYGNPYGSPIVRAQLDIDTAGGPVSIGTDSSWRTKESCITQIGNWGWSDMGGERWDAAKFIADWNLATFNDAAWSSAKEIAAPAVIHSWPAMPGSRTLTPIQATRVSQINGKWVIDFGTTLTGWARLRMNNLTPGQQITIDYADLIDRPELMHIADSNGFQTFGQHDIYIAGASSTGEFCSRFNQHAFRYAIIGGLTSAPALTDAEALPVMTALEPIGSFESSNPLFNKIYNITMATYRTQMPVGVLGGGESREKEGYGDAGTFLTGLLYNFRSDSYFRKWIDDYKDSQRADGFFTHTAPRHVDHGGGPPWGGQPSEMTRRLLLYHGDASMIASAYPALKRYVDFIETKTQNDILRYYSPYNDNGPWFLGDWVTPTASENEHGFPDDTMEEKEFFNNCYRVILWDQLATFAEKMGNTTEATRCRDRLAVIRPLIHNEFFDTATNSYRANRQAFLVVALLARIMPDELRPVILQQLIDNLTITRNGHLGTGMIGTSFMLDLLSREGRNDLVSTMMAKTTYPSWGFLSETRGVTTWPETWTGWGSQIILVTASPGAWFHEGLVGLRPDPSAPGFKKFTVKPGVVGEADWARASHQSPYGMIAVEWRKENGGLKLDVTVPPNSTAEIHVPASAVEDVTESGQAASGAPGVQFLRMENRHAVFAVGSGSYVFTGTLSTEPPDTTPPTSSSLNPTDNAIGVAVTANLDATFSENIAIGTGNITIKNVSDNSTTTIAITDTTQISISGNVLTINPTANLLHSKNYAIQIAPTAIKDLANNNFAGIADDTTWSFASAPPDTTPQSRTWNNGAGTGAWNGTDANWTGQTWTPGAAATLAHSATASTITLSSGLIAGSVIIGNASNNANYTFTGGSLTATSFTLQGKTDNDLGTAGYPTTTLNNTSLSVTSLVIGRGHLVIDGSSTVTAGTIGGPGGDPNGAWGQLTIAGTANVTATNGFSAGSTAWGLNLNGGTLTTKGLDYGPHTYIGSTNLNFNGTLVKANQNNANFITASGGFDFNPQIKAGGAKIDTNGFDIGIQVPLAGSGALTKSGAGTLTLSLASTYTGKTSVVNGTLILAQAFLNHTADVELTTSATLQLNFAATDTIDELRINGLSQASGTWGRIGHPTAQHTTSLITGNGLLQVTTGPAGGYAGWASTNGVIGQTPDQDHDNDGVENGIEYFMGQTGSSFTALPTLNAANTISWPADPAYQGTYEVQTSPDLATWTNVTPKPAPSGGTLSYTLPTGLGKQFVRLFVTPTP